MLGEELLDYVRYRVADHGLENYIHCNRALRDYCQQAGYDWLREINAAAIAFEADRAEYPLHELGLRRIDRIWVQDADNGEWAPLDERRGLGFERSVNEYTDDDGDVEEEPPLWFEVYGSNILTLRIGPVPSTTYQGRIDGIANTPVISRLGELPGPAEYHHLIGDIAAGYHLEHEGLTRLKQAGSQDMLFVAQALIKQGREVAAVAMASVQRVVRDSFPNRLTSLKPKKVPLMR